MKKLLLTITAALSLLSAAKGQNVLTNHFTGMGGAADGWIKADSFFGLYSASQYEIEDITGLIFGTPVTGLDTDSVLGLERTVFFNEPITVFLQDVDYNIVSTGNVILGPGVKVKGSIISHSVTAGYGSRIVEGDPYCVPEGNVGLLGLFVIGLVSFLRV